MNDIRAIKIALKERGFYKGAINDVQDPQTDQAIIAFKRSVGLRARSFVGPLTRDALGLKRNAAQTYQQPWMNEAANHLGLREIPGKRHNSTIVRWNRQLGAWWTDDETPWCGTFVAFCLRSANHSLPKHWYRARAYADWGMPCEPRVGAIAVFGRRGGGHVGFVVGESDDTLYILGGNQRNQVNISPIAKSRLVNGGKGACRWPSAEPLGPKLLPRMSGGRRTTNEA
ncbi:MAG: TIGR02594 family protein [Pseudomonadota bacterium]